MPPAISAEPSGSERQGTLSLVVAVHSPEAGRQWLGQVRRQASAAGAEIVLIGPGADERWAVPGQIAIQVAGPGILTPTLWAHGISRSRSEAVALTIAECLPADNWVSEILTALEDTPGAAAVGGVVDLDPAGGPADWALYFLRYSAYMPPAPRGLAREIAADNAVYRRAALDRYPEAWHGGFWEPSVHARFREDGLAILMDPRMIVRHRHSLSPTAFSRQRFLHGWAFGAARFGGTSVGVRMLRAVAAPIAGAVLTGRVVARVFARRHHRLRLLASLPLLMWFVACWIAGETLGYLVRPRRDLLGDAR